MSPSRRNLLALRGVSCVVRQDTVPTARTGTGLRRLVLCDTATLRGFGTRDRMVADDSGGESANTRELVLLGSPEAPPEPTGSPTASPKTLPRVGSARMMVTTYGEGSLASLDEQADGVTGTTEKIVPAVCVFTKTGC